LTKSKMVKVAESVERVFNETFADVRSTVGPLEKYYEKRPKRFGANLTDETLIGEALRHKERERKIKEMIEERDRKA